MKTTPIRSLLSATVAASTLLAFAPTAQAVDAEAAQALARQNNCLKCHSVDKEKDAPSFKKVAAKYKGKADAEQKLIDHITSGNKVKFADGHEEEHKVIKISPPKDMGQVKNLVQWILSQ